jgi:hypothetical protein
MDKDGAAMYAKDPAGAVAAITQFGVDKGEQLTKDWLQFWMCVARVYVPWYVVCVCVCVLEARARGEMAALVGWYAFRAALCAR